MKKNRIITILALAGAALVLAACTSQGTPLFPHNFEFKSSWTDKDTGEFIVCEDVDTVIEYSFRIGEGQRVSEIREEYVGVHTDETETYSIDPRSNIVERKRSGDATTFTVTRTIAAGSEFVPLSLSAEAELGTEAIIVKPIDNPDPVISGDATFRLYIKSGSAGYGIPSSDNAVELTVVSNCESA